MIKQKIVLHTINVLRKDIDRIDAKEIKLHKTEPRWSVIERAIDELEKKKRKD